MSELGLPGRLVAVVVAVSWLSGCASTLDEGGAVDVIPFRISQSGHIVVDGLVNGVGPFVFAVDSAASISVVFDKLIGKINQQCVPEDHVTIHGMVASGEFPVIRLDRLQIGRVYWDDARVAALPGDAPACAYIDGILGVDFLRHYSVGFSAREKVLRLYPPERLSQRIYQGWSAVPLREIRIGDSEASLYSMEIVLDRWPVTAIFDLGAGINMLNWRAARSVGAVVPSKSKRDELQGAVDSAVVVSRIEVDEVKAGGAIWRNKDFVVADLDVFTALGLEHEPVGIVGVGLFYQRDFIIDFAHERLLIKSPD